MFYCSQVACNTNKPLLGSLPNIISYETPSLTMDYKSLKTYQTVFIKHLKQQAMLSGINLKCKMERNTGLM